MIVIELINKVEIGTNAEENEGPAGGNKKDNVNEPAAASVELERSGSK